MQGEARSVRIDPEVLIRAYEAARKDADMGYLAWRLTPEQHLDVHHIVEALRKHDSPLHKGAKLETWVDYLSPAIAESGPARKILSDVLKEFVDPPPTGPVERPDRSNEKFEEQEKKDGKREGRLGWFGRACATLWTGVSTFLRRPAALALIGIGIAGVAIFAIAPKQMALPDRPTIPEIPIDVPQLPQSPVATGTARALAQRAYEQAWTATIAATNSSRELTPRRLAAAHVSREPRLGTPDTVLANILRAWPMPPDQPIDSNTDEGFAVLKRLTAEIAALRSGLPRVLFEEELPKQIRPPTGIKGTGAVPSATGTATWPKQWLALAALPLLLYLLYAAATHWRRVNDLTSRLLSSERRLRRKERATEGIEQTSAPFLVPAPKPFIAREPLRALTRYRPVAGRWLDGPRSVAALLRQEGFAAPVMRPLRRAVTYLVIIQRHQPHDHERLRLRQLFESVLDRGLPVFTYDYDRDPLLVKRAVAASGTERSEGINGREQSLRLSTLRDLHPNARLIFVTDGRDLMTHFGGRVRADIAKELSFWREGVILTPVPVGDWGQVELALSRDLDWPLGRTDEEAFTDLADAFRENSRVPPHRAALSRARFASGAATRLDAWWQATTERFGAAAGQSRGPVISFDDGLLTTDLDPPRDTILAIRDDLRRWLGPRGFLWHAACAIYPQLRYDLTIHIGSVLRSGPDPEAPVLFRNTPEDRVTLNRITALPWFRAGRMPEWLRLDVLSTLDADTLKRANAVIRKLFEAAPAGHRGPLSIWWPRTGALAIPPDAVMADALSGGVGPSADAARKDAVRRTAHWTLFRRELRNAALVGVACFGIWWFAPDLSKSPHTAGAWFPLFSFLSACLVTLGVVLTIKWVSPAKTPLPPSPATGSRDDSAGASSRRWERDQEYASSSSSQARAEL